MCPPFASHLNFLDQQTTKDGKPYGPFRYKQLVHECYAIAKATYTPYSDVLQMTPIEREYIIEFIKSDNDRQTKLLDEQVKQMQSNKKR